MKSKGLPYNQLFLITKGILQLLPSKKLFKNMPKSVYLIMVIIASMALNTSFAQLQTKVDNAIEQRVKETLKKNAETLRFMENKGQITNKDVLYYFQGTNGSAYIERNKIRFVANKDTLIAHQQANNNKEDANEPQLDRVTKAMHTFTLNMIGSNPESTLELGESFATKYNYYLGKNANDAVTGVKAAKDLTFTDIYPGINLRLYSTSQGSLEFDWVLKPGADFSKVKLNFEGQDDLSIDKDGSIKVGLRFTDVKFNIPESYQVTNKGKVPINFSFNKKEENTVVFQTKSKIDPQFALVIDPILSWGTYMDGNFGSGSGVTQFDAYLYAIQVDPVDGMVYCAGRSNKNIPTNSAPYDADGYLNSVTNLNGAPSSGIPDVAVVYRVNSTGTDLVDLTLYGPSSVTASSTNSVEAYALSLSATSVFIGGFTNVDIPTVNAFDGTRNSDDGFVAVFSRDLGTLKYASYLGGTGADTKGVTSIRAIDDNSFVVGMTVAAALPTSGPNYISTTAQSGYGGGSDFYIAKFITDLKTLSWGTYVGGTGNENFNDLEIFPDGRVAFCGYGDGSITEKNSAAASGSGLDGIIGVLTSNGSGFNYLDKIGGSSDDKIYDVEIVAETLYFTGAVGSGFPTSTGAKYTTYFGGTSDAIVGSVDAAGSTNYKATFYGTSGTDIGNGIRLVNQTGCSGEASTFLLVFGTVNASGLPTKNINSESFYNATWQGGRDIFFGGFKGDLTDITYGTYMGGSGDDYLGSTGDSRGANHLWVNGANVYVGTTSHSTVASTLPALVGGGGFDQTKDNSSNDSHILFSIQFASLLVSDYGDAPASYGTPGHIMDCQHLRIGLLIDDESGNQPSTNADGDNLNKLNDEDGVFSIPGIYSGPSQTYSITVNNLLNTTGSPANLYGWIDFNGDGAFQSNEFTSVIVPYNINNQTAVLTWSGVTVSGDAAKRYVRIRLTTNNLSDNTGTTGIDERSTQQASNGEVEDYRATGLNCPVAATELPCQTQSAIDTKYAAWLATSGGGGSCNGVLTNNAPANAPSVGAGGTVTVTFTYTSNCAPTKLECTSTFTVQAASNIQLSSSITTPITCNGGGNATVLISATGGTAPYTGTGSL